MEERTIKISLETAKEWYNGDNQILRNLALQAFNENELKVYRVRSWEEFCKQYDLISREYYIDSTSDILIISRNCRDVKTDRNLLETPKDVEAFLALMQLKRLRDQWWKSLNWKPDYTIHLDCKYCIMLVENKIVINHTYVTNMFLAFSTKEIAEDFLNCFKGLIEKAKEFI